MGRSKGKKRKDNAETQRERSFAERVREWLYCRVGGESALRKTRSGQAEVTARYGRGLPDLAHEFSGGARGFFDFGNAVDAWAGALEMLSKNIRVGSDDAEEILESMSDEQILAC